MINYINSTQFYRKLRNISKVIVKKDFYNNNDRIINIVKNDNVKKKTERQKENVMGGLVTNAM